MQNNIIAENTIRTYKYTTLKIVATPSLIARYSFLDYYILLCNKKICSQAWVSLLLPPPPPPSLPGRLANSSQNCCPCSFCSSIWALIHGSVQFQYLFLELEAMNSSESRWRCIKMYEARVSAKTAKEYLKIFVEQVIRLQSKVWSSL